MRGDFTRSSYNAKKHYTSVRMQQGRVQLDSDWNEHADIVDHRIQAPLSDLLGTFAAPAGSTANEAGFAIKLVDPPQESGYSLPFDFSIDPGHCYVDGILCENDAICEYSSQPQKDLPVSAAQQGGSGPNQQQYIVYLDVWHQLVTCLEDPDIREVALDGADTGARTKTVWQVKLLPIQGQTQQTAPSHNEGAEIIVQPAWKEFLEKKVGQRGRLTVKQTANTRAEDNQLYRVEIHGVKDHGLTFKMSRENGSVAYRFTVPQVLAPGTFKVQLEESDPSKVYLEKGNWVELELGDVLNGTSDSPLFEVGDLQNQDDSGIIVILCGELPAAHKDAKGGIVRRWDQHDAPQSGKPPTVQADGLVHVDLLPGNGQPSSYALESGIEVQFSADGTYQANDYWLIPVRTQVNSDTTGITWLDDQPPHGIDHHYAPLGQVYQESGSWKLALATDSQFSTLPELTAGLARLTQDVAELTSTVGDLVTTVNGLTQKVDRLESQIRRLGRQLFQEFEAVGHLEHGDLVAIHPHDEDLVVPATVKNEKQVIGVVDEALSDPEKEGKVRVVVHGIVPCKVVGEVTVGDLLVVSDREKHAKRAGHFVRPGTAIGKALQSFRPPDDHTGGKVDVMITL